MSRMRRFTFTFDVVLITTFVSSTFSNGDYRNIVAKVFNSYDSGIRPVMRATTTTNVKIHFGIVELLTVEQISKTFICQAFMEMIWTDEYLTWNPEEFGNASSIRYPAQRVWSPDIILVNSPDSRGGSIASDSSTNMIINSDGTVYNDFITVYKVACASMDMSRFPFDEHECHLEFTSWTYSGEEVDIFDDMASYKVPESLKLVQSAEWQISVEKAQKIVAYDCCPNGSYPSLRIPVKLKRRPLHYIINVILPITVTCSICFIGMFSPSTSTGDRTEKVFLGITTLLAISLLMFSVSSQLPVTSNGLPTIGLFLGMYIITISLAIICTTGIMWVDIRGLEGKPLPEWVRPVFFKRIGKVLFVHSHHEKHIKDHSVPKSAETVIDDNKDNTKVDKFLNTAIGQVLQKIEDFLDALLKEKRSNKSRRHNRNEWSSLCSVLDRICLIIFLLYSIAFTVILFSIR